MNEPGKQVGFDRGLARYIARKLWDDIRSEHWEQLDSDGLYAAFRWTILAEIREKLVTPGDAPLLLRCAQEAPNMVLRLFAIHGARVTSSDAHWNDFRSLAKKYFGDVEVDPRIRCGLVFQILHRVDDPSASQYLDWCWKNPKALVDWSIHYFDDDPDLLLSECTREPRFGDPAYKPKLALYAYLIGHLGGPREAEWLRSRISACESPELEAMQWAQQMLVLRRSRRGPTD